MDADTEISRRWVRLTCPTSSAIVAKARSHRSHMHSKNREDEGGVDRLDGGRMGLASVLTAPSEGEEAVEIAVLCSVRVWSGPPRSSHKTPLSCSSCANPQTQSRSYNEDDDGEEIAVLRMAVV